MKNVSVFLSILSVSSFAIAADCGKANTAPCPVPVHHAAVARSVAPVVVPAVAPVVASPVAKSPEPWRAVGIEKREKELAAEIERRRGQ